MNHAMLRQVDRALAKLSNDQRLDILVAFEKKLMGRFCSDLADPRFSEIFGYELRTLSAIRQRISQLEVCNARSDRKDNLLK